MDRVVRRAPAGTPCVHRRRPRTICAQRGRLSSRDDLSLTTVTVMDERLRSIERANGVFLRSEARELGHDDKAIANAVRWKVWHRVRHGAYCHTDTWLGADAVERHRIKAQAVMRSLTGRVALSHVSALVLHGLPVWGADLAKVHVTRLDGGPGRIDGDVVHHEGKLVPDDLIVVREMVVTDPRRAVLESCTILGTESGLVSMDALLNRELATREEVAAAAPQFEQWPGALTLQLVLRLTDGRAASPGESRSRYMFWSQNLPAPELQFHVYDDRGDLAGITDFAWPAHGVLGEFDGRVKYGRHLTPGKEPGDVVFEEKRREDRLREVTGFTMVRIVWSELSTPAATAARFARHLRRPGSRAV